MQAVSVVVVVLPKLSSGWESPSRTSVCEGFHLTTANNRMIKVLGQAGVIVACRRLLLFYRNDLQSIRTSCQYNRSS